MKYLLVIAVVGFVLWLMSGRSRRPMAPKARDPQPLVMVGCSHCGVHLPQNEAVADAAGRFYCGDAHRLAGPR